MWGIMIVVMIDITKARRLRNESPMSPFACRLHNHAELALVEIPISTVHKQKHAIVLVLPVKQVTAGCK